jgi:2-succinyl-6-hydroxy-2,4-cyclohexadiene-1-carboxylate synthase
VSYVLLHGFTGAPSSFDALALEPAFAPRLAGHGPAPVFSRSWDDEIDRILAAIRGEGIGAAHLIGYSMGGRVGWHLLARAPELFRSATLIGAHPGLPTEAERALRRESDARFVEILETQGLTAFVDVWEALPMWRTQQVLTHDGIKLDPLRSVRLAHTARGLAHAIRILGLAEMPAIDPARISVPVHLVCGALDSKHRAIAERIAPRMPRARCSVIEGAGHNVLFENPAAILGGET